MVRRLVEHQQVGVGDDEPGERGARLLAAGQRGRRLGPSRRGRTRGRTAPRRRGGPACSRRAPRIGAGDRRTRAPRRGSSRSSAASSLGHPLEVRRRRCGPRSRTSGAAMNPSSRCASCASSPTVRPRLRWTSPASGSSLPAAIRSSVVFPAPFGPTRPIRSPSAIAASMPIEDDERADLADRRRSAARSTSARPHAVAGGGPARRSGPLRALRSRAVRARGSPRGPPSAASGRTPLPGQLGPAPSAPHVAAGQRRAGSSSRRRARSAGRRWHHEQKCVDRAPMTIRLIGRPHRGHGSPVALVDLQALLHRAVALGRRVVVDGTAAPRDCLGEDRRGWRRRGGARRAAGATTQTAAGGAATATAPRPRRCCRRPPGTI